MPEIWIPFGSVETLVTLQAENLGAVLDPEPEKGTMESERQLAAVKDAAALFICDSNPTTVEFLREIVSGIVSAQRLRILSSAPKRIESALPELKGRVATLPPPVPSEAGDKPVLSPELTGPGKKLIVGTARPDPLFGIVDTRVQACLNWAAHALSHATYARRSMEPTPFQRTTSYEKLEKLSEEIASPSFLTVVPRAGKVRSVLEDAPFDAVKNGFFEAEMPAAKALVLGAGGRGYDDTLSSALRCVWGPLAGLRNSGTLLLVAECSEGLGSTALEMLATGRLSGDVGKKGDRYVEGMEEVFYLNKLKEDYDVLLLSGLPEVYAKQRLGLTTAKGSGEAVGRLLNKVGRTGKVNLVTRASECRVRSA
ncbi:MAG: hypothetical protein HY297_01705 [Thaumarchaeota archaeon]|nr:hypothetical protein [Nitrososphaerota archaeon]